MAKAAKESGATYAKYQTWSVDRLKPGSWDKDGRREIYEKAELSIRDHIELINYCDEIGITFLSSVFSIADAKLLVELGCKEVKIPSFESRNENLIHHCLKYFSHLLISTGTSTYDEMRLNTKFLDNDRFKMNDEIISKLKRMGFTYIENTSKNNQLWSR